MNGVILCADPDEAARDRTEAALADEGAAVVTESSLSGVKRAIDEDHIDCVVTEYDLDGGSGLDVVKHVRENAPDLPCVLFTDVSPTDIDTNAVGGLIVEYLNKESPGARERLGPLVDDLIDHRAQVSYLLPDDEDDRLEALAAYDVDELDIEDTFDRLSELVAAHFDVPVAFIGLVEEHEENFIACHGADWDSLNREDTICTHNILDEDVMVVEDITEDHRFQNNDTLVGLGIQSYAGANLAAPDGSLIGSLCLIDYEPRTYTDDQREQMQQFADEAMEQLELRRRLLEAEGAADEHIMEVSQ